LDNISNFFNLYQVLFIEFDEFFLIGTTNLVLQIDIVEEIWALLLNYGNEIKTYVFTAWADISSFFRLVFAILWG